VEHTDPPLPPPPLTYHVHAAFSAPMNGVLLA